MLNELKFCHVNSYCIVVYSILILRDEAVRNDEAALHWAAAKFPVLGSLLMYTVCGGGAY